MPNSPVSSQRVKVLYIMGAPRCGSTVLDNILNGVDGFFSAGELRFLWQRLHQERFCGCGKPFESCEVWSRVLQQVATLRDTDPQAAMNRQKGISGTWRTWQLLHQASKGTIPPETEAHRQLAATLYRSIEAVTGARVIVDSSKRPWDAALLGTMTEVSPYFIHLVRDPRAMAYSQSKLKANPDRDQAAVMAPTGVLESALQWVRRNLTADAVRRAHPAERSMLIDYHEFCSRPFEIVRAITTLVGERGMQLPFLDDHTVNLEGNHTVSGNPDRFRTGPVPIREDNRWKEEMPGWDKLIVTLLTTPVMRHYSNPNGRRFHDLGSSSEPAPSDGSS